MLRSPHLFTDGELIWAVDAFQPVAALLDAATGALRDVVSWRSFPPPPLGETWRVTCSGSDLWVQPGARGPVGRIGPSGLLAAGYSAARSMVAVSSHGAWCVTDEFVQQLVTSPDYVPRRLPHDQVIVVGPDGSTSRVGVDRPVRDVHVTVDGVFLEVEDGPHSLRHLGADTWEVLWRRAFLRVPEGVLPPYLRSALIEAKTLPRRLPSQRLDQASVPPVDISAHCWPLGPAPVDADSYARSQRDRFSDLDHAWHDVETGDSGPLADGTSNWICDLDGSWPHTRLVITFSHRDYPGVRLRRSVPLFDEIGRIDPPEFADIHLMEDLDTGNLPPASAAVDGLLDV